MNKQILWLFFVLLVAFFALVYCDENVESALEEVNRSGENEVQETSRDLIEEGRTRRRHKKYHLFWGWHALALAYWIKVKVVIVAFFLGSAVFWGIRYFWPHKCHSGVVREGPIVYDNPHVFSHHDDHIPYSLDHSDHFSHSFDSSSFEPYSGYAGAYSDAIPTGVDASSGPPVEHNIKRRSLPEESRQRQKVPTEEQIADLMFSFLGLDSRACRRRFICEMEFRSNQNPISGMAFRIVGRGFFEKYRYIHNTHGLAKSFTECAAVNPDCVFIEQDVDEEENLEHETNSTEPAAGNENPSDSDSNVEENHVDATQETEAENEINLTAERKYANRRRRTNKRLDLVVNRIFSKSNPPVA